MTRERQEWKPSWRCPNTGLGFQWNSLWAEARDYALIVDTDACWTPDHGAWRPPDEDRIASLLRRMWQLGVCEDPNHGFDARTHREVGLDVRVFGARAHIVPRDETAEVR